MNVSAKVIGFLILLLFSARNFAALLDTNCGTEATGIPPATSIQIEALAKVAVSLKTPRLILRTPRITDMPAILKIFNDPETVKYTYFALAPGQSWTLESVTQKFSENAKLQLQGVRHDFVIELNDASHTVIGRCALYPATARDQWELGITIHRPYWGNHYGPEVLKRLFQYAFEEIRTAVLWLLVEQENAQMIQVMERFGIPKTLDARFTTPTVPHFHRYHHYTLTQERWFDSIRTPAILP